VNTGRIDARHTVAALVHSYAEHLDLGDFDAVADLFAAATFAGPGGGVRRGRDEVRHLYDRVVLYSGSPRTKHVISNLVVDVDEIAGTAGSRCQFSVLHNPVAGQPIRVVLAGRYVDTFHFDGERWAFASRVVHVDLTGDLRPHYR
jgi:hypothetical protein